MTSGFIPSVLADASSSIIFWGQPSHEDLRTEILVVPKRQSYDATDQCESMDQLGGAEELMFEDLGAAAYPLTIHSTETSATVVQPNVKEWQALKSDGAAHTGLFLWNWEQRKELFQACTDLGIKGVRVTAWREDGTKDPEPLAYDLNTVIHASGWQRACFHEALGAALAQIRSGASFPVVIKKANEAMRLLWRVERFEIGGTSSSKPPPTGGSFDSNEIVRNFQRAVRAFPGVNDAIFKIYNFESTLRFIGLREKDCSLADGLCPKAKAELKHFLTPATNPFFQVFESSLSGANLSVALTFPCGRRTVQSLDLRSLYAQRGDVLDAAHRAFNAQIVALLIRSSVTVEQEARAVTADFYRKIREEMSWVYRTFEKHARRRKSLPEDRKPDIGYPVKKIQGTEPGPEAGTLSMLFEWSAQGLSLIEQAARYAAEVAGEDLHEDARFVKAILEVAQLEPPTSLKDKREFARIIRDEIMIPQNLRVSNGTDPCLPYAQKIGKHGRLALRAKSKDFKNWNTYKFATAVFSVVRIKNSKIKENHDLSRCVPLID